MSSERPVIFSMRRTALAVPGSSRVRSRVRYRTIGIASLVREVRTSSPYSPSSSTSPVSGSTTSGKKWSSHTCRPSLVSTHSLATPGPITSDRP